MDGQALSCPNILERSTQGLLSVGLRHVTFVDAIHLGTNRKMGKRGRVSGEITLVDQSPIRRRLAAECTAAREQLEQARSGWHRFERKDRPAFIRWRAREFGALLSEAREVEDRIRDAQALVHEVESEMRRHFQDPYSAYQRVMFRRENPAAAEPPQAAEKEMGKPDPNRRLSDFEKETLFQEWVQKFIGTHPDKLDDDVYSSTFEV